MSQAILSQFLLHIADSQLVLSQRLSEWCGHAPELEIDIALANIGLDLLGQARTAYSLAGEIEGLGRDEDQLAFLRGEREYLNLLLCEQPNIDFAQTIVRQWLMDHYHSLLFAALSNSSNANLSAFAIKSLKEVKYHLRFSTAWMERLSLSTDEAHEKTQSGLNELWRFSAELFELTDAERQELVKTNIIPNIELLKDLWLENVSNEIQRFELNIPETGAYRRGAKQGMHTEHLGYVLAEMQYMQRAFPNMTW
ncbi:1,2-phenylacetyl-CoA epoxidase subunit PaaC [Acinetobacter gerneri]|jgi:ring-1,2-phenylacetyl-CoA epoxidase subunit PaaC|uniref:1,2-phenylacetyl-CoA epoxidase subunit PaaC n=1 Tax=Acinetobacter gerneri TaxID=202952 RepID=A0AAW8JJ86_9GAMM|nr:1,2-phenylacetyl-CoA epoxidase subunit PaaC [Acinetobacter gerneri]MCH4242614.1 phenylacetate-CoA oxygenase subunit PaaC [Acinetobacter gerneri]MDQ9009606.1 1,2-phenylacetyl-CoA epoxidase subunit PaaC [Acinetobacter gerneri]MDQ9013798.1 1,2-phenylacetyl-CoA epoxidase subunit PaaC [Acinetobacter gerneri]MDQ9024966.1 1,2-phenylacetyl-CoA epoxidase subunit PaaC [Acinetobacter gerneri]MDQ9052274.1 1,2-phenylacetyl-CoA epoxidase subunit PaaC [Acinetobacter gerneri]